MSLEEFRDATGIDDALLVEAHAIFTEEVDAHMKTFAARAADLADGLRGIGADEDAVSLTVRLLAEARRR